MMPLSGEAPGGGGGGCAENGGGGDGWVGLDGV